MSASGGGGSAVTGVSGGGGHLVPCMHCQERKQVLKYIFPTPEGKKEFCSVACLAAFRASNTTNSPLANGGTTVTNSLTKSPHSNPLETPPKLSSIDRCGVSPAGSQSGRSSDEGPPFLWKEYLRY